jgi:hypothetical protein
VGETAKIGEESWMSIVAVCNRLFEDFGDGLIPFLKDPDSKSSEMPWEAVHYPDKFLSEQITNFIKTQRIKKEFPSINKSQTMCLHRIEE